MPRPFALPVLALALLAFPELSAAADPPAAETRRLVVELVAEIPPPGPDTSAEDRGAEESGLSLRLVDVTTEEERVRQVSAEPRPSTSSFRLAPGTYRLSVTGDGWWAPDRVMEVPADVDPAPITLPFYRTGLVRARVRGARDQSAAGDYRAKFRLLPEDRERDGEWGSLTGTSTCGVDGRVLLCEVPAAVLDLRLEVDGFAPVYRWGLEVEPQSAVPLGDLALVRGASVSGTVLDQHTRSGHEVARIRIELPDTTLRGRVIDEADRPQPAARLLAVDVEEGSRELTEIADDEGRFEFRGLTPATLRLRAESEAGTSDWVAVRLEEGREGPDVVLRIAEARRLRGRVISPSGPVADATVTLIPSFTMRGPVVVVEANTAVDGTFEARVPAHVRSLNVLVLPPGFAAKIATHHLGPVAGGEAAEAPLEIRVTSGGGTLELAPRAGREGARPPGLLRFGEGMVGIEHFAEWSRLQGAPSVREGRIRIPSLESGWYRFCRRSSLAPEGTPGRAAGAPPCDEGFLPAGGELTLSIESSQESPR